jgi:hypothetical protein
LGVETNRRGYNLVQIMQSADQAMGRRSWCFFRVKSLARTRLLCIQTGCNERSSQHSANSDIRQVGSLIPWYVSDSANIELRAIAFNVDNVVEEFRRVIGNLKCIRRVGISRGLEQRLPHYKTIPKWTRIWMSKEL